MALSWRARKPVSTERSDTIAEGIEVRVPVPESVTRLVALIDDMVLVDEAICSTRWSFRPGRSGCYWSRQRPRASPPYGFTICRAPGWRRS